MVAPPAGGLSPGLSPLPLATSPSPTPLCPSFSPEPALSTPHPLLELCLLLLKGMSSLPTASPWKQEETLGLGSDSRPSTGPVGTIAGPASGDTDQAHSTCALGLSPPAASSAPDLPGATLEAQCLPGCAPGFFSHLSPGPGPTSGAFGSHPGAVRTMPTPCHQY